MSLLFLNKLFAKPIKSSINNSRKSSKRGVADVIAAMLLLSVTIAGGAIVFFIVMSSDQLTFVTSERQSINPNVISELKLTGYDTRDIAGLYNITPVVINNQIEPSTSPDVLCTKTDCATGTEFIILKVRNNSDIVVEITSISINEVEHTFHVAVLSGNAFAANTFPAAGEFIIISGSGISGIKQELTSFLPEGSEKRLLIRLSTTIDPNIPLNSKIRVVINSSIESTQLLLVPAGRLA